MARSNRNSEFAERISWPLSLWLFLGLMLASIYLTFWAPFNALVATIVCLLIVLTLIYAQYKTRLEIVVINNWLYVDKAKVEVTISFKTILLPSEAPGIAPGFKPIDIFLTPVFFY